MGKGTVTSDEHVDVKWADGTLSADKLKITGGGEVVRFDGHVVMNIDKLPPAESAPEQPANARLRPSPRRTPPGRGRSPASPPTPNDPMTIFPRSTLIRRMALGGCCAAFALAAIAAGEAAAQSAVTGVPNAMQGFSQNRDQPIQIEAASLEMRDKKKEATFSGNVKVVQGDTTMTSKTLVVFYEFEFGSRGGAGGQFEDRGKIGADPVRDPRSRRQPRRSSGWRREAMWS